MNSKVIGNIGEAITIAEFVRRGIPVYTSFGENERADLIAEFNGKLNKIQCRTSERFEDNVIVWRLTSSTSTGVHVYDKSEIDYFSLYNIESKILLLVPIEIINGRKSINVPIPYRKTNQNTPLNYEDYLYDTVLDNIRFDS